MKKTIFMLFFLVLLIAPRKFTTASGVRLTFAALGTPIKPDIVDRELWDDNEELLAQYDKLFGEQLVFDILGKRRWRWNNSLSYLDAFSICEKELSGVYRKIDIHNTKFEHAGDACEQTYYTRDGQVVYKYYDFNDIAYNFMIGKGGIIVEGRPLTHIGTHAGRIKELHEKSWLWKLQKLLANGDFAEYWRAYDEMVEVMKADPDFGAIGICLVGDFDKREPQPEVIKALVELTAWLVCEFNISLDDVIYHKEEGQRVKTQGHKLTWKRPKTCPGKLFPDRDCFTEMVNKQIIEWLTQTR